MIKKIIFLISWPLNLRDYQRFGVDVLTRNGLEVLFFDFSPFLSPEIEKKATIPDLMTYKGRHCFGSEASVIRAISNLDNKECFFIVLRPYGYSAFKIYRALSKAKVPYAISVTNAVPPASVSRSKSQVFFRRLSKISLPKVKRLFINHLLQPKFSKYLGIRPPTFWLAGGTSSLNGYFNLYPFGKNTEILWLHTLDYDIYLKNNSVQSINACSKAVFLDLGGPQFTGDEIIAGRPSVSITKERYYPTICRFFDTVEKEHGVTVEIASHPRSNHQPHPDYFGGRLAVRGRTFQMVQQSKFVITHASTAINFAVLLKKPIIFIMTIEQKSDIYQQECIKNFACWLKKTPIYIDAPYKIDWDKELTVDEDCYMNYKNCYIKKPGSEDLNSWQIFANRLKRL